MRDRRPWWGSAIALTSAASNDLFRIDIATGEETAATWTITFTVINAAGHIQKCVTSGTWAFANKTGTPEQLGWTVNQSELGVTAGGGGTFSVAFADPTLAAGSVTISCTPTTSLTPTVFRVNVSIDMDTPVNIVPLL